MKYLGLSATVLVLTLSFAIGAVAQSGDDAILGQWYTEDQRSIVQIYKEDGKYQGKMIALKNPKYGEDEPELEGQYVRDRNNPDPEKRSNHLVGNVIMQGFTYDADDNEWSGGKIYDPDNGKTYSCVVKLDDPNTLAVRGYILIRTFGRTTEWKRVPKDEQVDLEKAAKDSDAPSPLKTHYAFEM